MAFEGRCRAPWNHFELTLGSLLAYENEFGIIMVSSYSHEAQFSKNIPLPNKFKWFLEGIIRVCDHFEATLVSH